METKALERPPLRIIVGANVRWFRRKKSPVWSQDRLARETGFSKGAIQLIENAEKSLNELRLGTLEKLAEALGVDPVELLQWRPEATRVYLQGEVPRLSLVVSNA